MEELEVPVATQTRCRCRPRKKADVDELEAPVATETCDRPCKAPLQHDAEETPPAVVPRVGGHKRKAIPLEAVNSFQIFFSFLLTNIELRNPMLTSQ